MLILRGARKNLLCIFASLVCFAWVFSTTASAVAPDPGFNITASPLPIELNTVPGQPISTNLRIENSGTAPIQIKVSLLKFKAAGAEGKPQLLKRQPGDTYFDWVSFSTNSFLAQPGVWNDIGVTISPPKDAAFGYYYAVVFGKDAAGPNPSTPLTGKLNGAVATLVLLNVQAPGEKKQLQVTAFSSSKKLYEYLPASFNIRVHNSGNIHLVPRGNIFISKGNNKVISVLSVNTTSGNILPASNRVFQTNWDKGYPVFVTKRDNGQIISDKQGTPIQQLDWSTGKNNGIRFGHYNAHLLLTYDNGTRDVPIEADVGFWVIPWKIILVFVALLLLVIMGLITSGRSILKGLKKTRRSIRKHDS